MLCFVSLFVEKRMYVEIGLFYKYIIVLLLL